MSQEEVDTHSSLGAVGTCMAAEVVGSRLRVAGELGIVLACSRLQVLGRCMPLVVSARRCTTNLIRNRFVRK